MASQLNLSALVSLVLLVGSGAAPAAFAQDKKVNCTDPQTQMEMTQCAGEDYDKADKDLNVEYQKLRKLLGERDKVADENGKGEVDALVAAQRAWVAYRDANCNLEGFQARGGSMEPQLVASCLAQMSRDRTQELKTLSAQFW
ncbi:MAG: lysozyme inhibitor LprI family protein [Agrobacterium cavarae]